MATSASFAERWTAIAAMVLSTGAFLPLLQGARDPELGAWKGTLLTNSIWIFLYGWFGYLLLYRYGKPFSHLLRSWPFLLPIPIALLSVVWSQDKWLTTLRCVTLAGTTVIALFLFVRFTIKQMLLLLAWAFGIIGTASATLAIMVPKYGLTSDDAEGPVGTWLGVFGQKNTLGSAMTIAFLVYTLLFLYDKSHRARWLVCAVCAFGIVLLSDSMTSLGICAGLLIILGATCFVATGNAISWRRALILLFVASVMLPPLIGRYENLLDTAGKDPTFTGRTVLWALVWESILDQPVLGYGYGAFWRGYEGRSGEIWSQMGQFLFYSHSGFLEVWLQIGAIGLIAMVVALFSSGSSAARLLLKGRTLTCVWPWMFIAYVCLSNLLEGNLMMSNTLPWLLYTYTALKLATTRGSLDREPAENHRFGSDGATA